MVRRAYMNARSRRGGERGQMLLIFALIVVPVTFAVGVVAVDASLWQSERRGAQKDADLAALAGALELIPDVQDQNAAETSAIEYGDINDEAGNSDSITVSTIAGEAETVFVSNECFGTARLDSVSVNIDHKSRTFFAEAFGMNLAPEIGAHARACVGSLTNPRGLRPFAIDKETSPCFVQPEDNPSDPDDIGSPNFGATCTMDFGAQDAPGGPNRGLLDLEPNSSTACSINGGGTNDVRKNIEDGANAYCFTNDGTTCAQPYTNCVLGKTGNVAEPVPRAIRTLLEKAVDCDGSDSNDYDDFEEAVELFGGGTAPPDPDNLFTPVTCSDGQASERLITIVAIEEWPDSNNDPMPVKYFVPMYILGCMGIDPDTSLETGVLWPMCDRDAEGPTGHIRLMGIIFRAYLVNSGDVAAPDESGTRAITLDQ